MPTNTAAYLLGPKVKPLQVTEAPYPTATSNQIIVKNAAVAINPADWLKQDRGNLLFPWVKYPFILGYDVAGEVVQVGASVTRFQVGDRVVGMAVGIDSKYNDSAQGAFQTYTVLLEHMTAPIPDSLSYENAAVVPLGLTTAAAALFEKDQLALEYPTVPARKPNGKTVIIWGGSTSVGSNAIQLAVAAGYSVITTASPRNFEYVKNLGASHVFDYNSPTVVADILTTLGDSQVAGGIAIGHGAAEALFDILHHSKGKKKFLSMVSYPMLPNPPKRLLMVAIGYYYVSRKILYFLLSKWRRIGIKYVFSTSIADNRVGKAIYEDFLPEALAEGVFRATPEPHVVGRGLEKIQEAFEVQKRGLSAKKPVVLL